MNTTPKQTSLDAYRLMQPKIPIDREAILEVLKINDNMTYHEIAKALRWLDPSKASRRMPELVRLNLVEISGEKICTVAKSRCTTYKIKT